MTIPEPTPYQPWENMPAQVLENAKKEMDILHKTYMADDRMTGFNCMSFSGKVGNPTFFTCFGNLRSQFCSEPPDFSITSERFISHFLACFIRKLPKNKDCLHFPEQEDKFLEWIFNDSMFSEIFVTKSAKEAREQGVICNTHVPCGILVQACTFARSVSHMARIPKMWDILTQAGVDPHIALLCAHQFSPTKPDDYDEIVPIMMDGGNSVFNSLTWFTDDGFRRFVNNNREKWHGNPMYKQPGQYGWFLTQWQTPAKGFSEGAGFETMQDYGYVQGTAIPLADAIWQAKHLQEKYIE